MKHEDIIKNNSKSFSLASLFFSKKEKIASWKLYSWCRYCDDLIDEVSEPRIMKERLLSLRSQTNQLSMHTQKNFYFTGMSEVMHEFKFPINYPLDLIRGMEMDVEGKRFGTLKELEEYCYCVAGTVGLMMCHILGIRHEMALSYAVAMGKAMQFTNIARDITEDQRRGRLYIPLSWLNELGVTEEELFLESNRDKLIFLQERLLSQASAFYDEGYVGLKYLSLRSSWAVMIASLIYAEIGKVIRNNPALSLKIRAVVLHRKKWGLIILSTMKMFPLVLQSIKQNKVRAPESVWSIS